MAVKVGSLLIDIKANTQELVKGMSKAEKSVKKTMSNIKSAIAGLAVGAAFKSAFTTGFNYNKLMEEQEQALTALIAATSKHEDAMGNVITNTELYNRANQEAVAVLKDLEEINKSTPHTLGQTAQIYKTMLPSMKSLGVGTKDLVNITKQLSIAAGAGGVQFQSLLAGVDGLATGTVLANSDLGRFLSTIGLSNDALKGTTDIVGLLNDKLGSFEAPKTMEVAISNLANAWGKFMGTITSGSFSGAKDAINGLADIINEYQGYLEGASIAGRAYVSKLVDGLKLLVEYTKAAFIGLSDGISGSFNSMLSSVQISMANFVYSLKDIPGIGDEMVALAIKLNTMGNLTKENANQNLSAINKQKAAIKAASDEYNKSIYERINLYDAELAKQKAAEKQAATIAKDMELSIAQQKELAKAKADLLKQNEALRSSFERIRDSVDSEGAKVRTLVSNMELLNEALAKGIITQEEYNETAKNLGDNYVDSFQKAKDKANDLKDTIGELSDKVSGQLESTMTSTFRSWMDGATNFSDLFKNMLKDIAAELFRVLVIQQAVSGIKTAMGFSTGGVISNGVQAFANGGIVNSPTYFPMSSGTGLMGEAGTEAIMPVTRIGGDLGVKVDQSPINVNVINNGSNNVDVSQNKGSIEILISEVENSIASRMTRGTSPLGGALNIMKSQGRL